MPGTGGKHEAASAETRAWGAEYRKIPSLRQSSFQFTMPARTGANAGNWHRRVMLAGERRLQTHQKLRHVADLRGPD